MTLGNMMGREQEWVARECGVGDVTPLRTLVCAVLYSRVVAPNEENNLKQLSKPKATRSPAPENKATRTQERLAAPLARGGRPERQRLTML